MAALGLHCCTWVLSPCVHLGLSCFHVWASHCISLSCFGERALGPSGSVAVAPGFNVPQHVGSSQPATKPMSLAWTGRFFTTELPGKSCWEFLNHSFNFSAVSPKLVMLKPQPPCENMERRQPSTQKAGSSISPGALLSGTLTWNFQPPETEKISFCHLSHTF